MSDKGKKLNVTRREFQNSFRSHYSYYKQSGSYCSGNEKTRRLILFYAVECGLKCLIMKNTHSNSYEELVRYCNNSQKVRGLCMRLVDIGRLYCLI